LKRIKLKRISALLLFFSGMSALVFLLPMTSYGTAGGENPYSMDIDVSPNIINIESLRRGDIRILTKLRYSMFVEYGQSIYIYFNDSNSVENISPSSDSLGNLILRFSLEELLVIESNLRLNSLNDVTVVVVMDNNDEYIGHDETYIATKR
jgi:hypothetical protein